MKKLVVLTLVGTFVFANISGVKAAEEPVNAGNEETSSGIEVTLSDEQKSALKRYESTFINTGLYEEFTIANTGKMLSSKGFDELKLKYNMSKDDMNFVQSFIESNNASVDASTRRISSRMYIEGFRVYLSYSEAKSYLGTAVAAGPVAITGALAVLGGTVGGPLGAVVCGIAGVYGCNAIVTTYTKAIKAKRGVWLGWGGVGIN